jgi:hypothetical protein
MKYLTFKREMARAYAEDRKRMTRRVIKWPKWIQNCDYSLSRIAEIISSNDYRGIIKRGYCDGIEHQYRCPYGQPGDQLILGTTWAVWAEYDNLKPRDLPIGSQIWSYFDSDEKPEGFGKLRPGRFLPGFLRDRMPNETLKIVRAERVQNITEEDALLEGIIKLDHGYFSERPDAKYDSSLPTARLAFANLINRIHGGKNWNLYYNDDKLEKPIWYKNPWVWCIGW